MDKILVCGAFDFGNPVGGGQPVKTRELFYALQNEYGKNNVNYIETWQWRKHPISLMKQVFSKGRKADKVIMLPAHNGVYVFSFLLYLLKRIFNSSIYYDVIGGWLQDKVKNSWYLKFVLQYFDGIWVETNRMKIALNDLNLKNVKVVNNFKQLPVVSLNDLPKEYTQPYKLCIFSRIMAEKGIDDIIKVLGRINSSDIKYTLDLYGMVSPEYQQHFDDLLKEYHKFISYKGFVKTHESITVLKNYFCLIFPTKFYTEGIPGTIIDAYASGLPVICSNWLSANDVVDDTQSGYLYEFDNTDALYELLEEIFYKPDMILSQKGYCLNKANEFRPNIIIKTIFEI